MLKKTIVTLMLAGVATVAAGETVYKWVDPRGQVHYTDLPPRESGARVLAVYDQQMGVGEDEEAPPEDEETVPPQPSFDDADQTSGEDRAAAAVQRDLAATRAEQCKQAQARYTQYIESQRLFRETADGKRQYLTDAELAKARVDAKKAVDQYCSP